VRRLTTPGRSEPVRSCSRNSGSAGGRRPTTSSRLGLRDEELCEDIDPLIGRMEWPTTRASSLTTSSRTRRRGTIKWQNRSPDAPARRISASQSPR
jgi:hypothetical protein